MDPGGELRVQLNKISLVLSFLALLVAGYFCLPATGAAADVDEQELEQAMNELRADDAGLDFLTEVDKWVLREYEPEFDPSELTSQKDRDRECRQRGWSNFLTPEPTAKSSDACREQLGELIDWMQVLEEQRAYTLGQYFPEGSLVPGPADLPAPKGGEILLDENSKMIRNSTNLTLESLQEGLMGQKKEATKWEKWAKNAPHVKSTAQFFTDVRLTAHQQTKWSVIVNVTDAVLRAGFTEVSFTFRRDPQLNPTVPPLTLFELFLLLQDAKWQTSDERKDWTRPDTRYFAYIFWRVLESCPGLVNVINFRGPFQKTIWLDLPDYTEVIARLKACECRVDETIIKSILWRLMVVQDTQLVSKEVKIGEADEGGCTVIEAGVGAVWKDVAAKILAVEDGEKVCLAVQ